MDLEAGDPGSASRDKVARCLVVEAANQVPICLCTCRRITSRALWLSLLTFAVGRDHLSGLVEDHFLRVHVPANQSSVLAARHQNVAATPQIR